MEITPETIDELQDKLEKDNLSCTISEDEITSREDVLRSLSKKLEKNVKSDNSYALYFPYDNVTAHTLLEFILEEHKCCEFFEFSLEFDRQEENIIFHVGGNELDPQTLDDIIEVIVNIA